MRFEDDIDRGLVKADFIMARREALRLFSCSLFNCPKEWHNETNILIVETISSFALHARRLTEAFGKQCFQGLEADWTPFPLKAEIDGTHTDLAIGEMATFLKDFSFCLNRIIHAKRLVVGWARIEKEVIWGSQLQPARPLYVVVETSQQPLENISLPGIAKTFLGPVSHRILEHDPQLKQFI